MLAKSFYDAGVVAEVIIYKHPKYTTHEEWYPPGTHISVERRFQGAKVDEFLKRIDVALFFETPFDWKFPEHCRERGIRTVCIPMYEWFPANPPHRFDKFICPSLLDVDYFPGSPFLTPPVDPSTWKLRTKALRFLHNSGHIGHRNHKGTAEVIGAIHLLRPEVTLTIRSQSPERLDKLVKACPTPTNHPGVTFEVGNLPISELYAGYDVLVAPEKFNGLSLPLQEGFAEGMAIMASDRYPANSWLPSAPLIAVDGYHPARLASNTPFQEAEISPASVAAKINEWYGRDITEFSLAGRKWADEHSWEVMKDKFLQELTI
jgi:hypothetical protein